MPPRDCRLANFFIKQGTLATLQGQQFATQTFAADPASSLPPRPLAVLVNRGTYGGPELTAAAIEDLKRGDVVGERTFGEGSFQKSIEMPDGADLLLTVAKFQSPSGNKIQDNAVTPNVVVASPLDDEEEGAPAAQGRRDARQGARSAQGQKRLRRARAGFNRGRGFPPRPPPICSFRFPVLHLRGTACHSPRTISTPLKC